MKLILRKLGLLPLARWLRHELPLEYRFRRFRGRYGKLLHCRTPRPPQGKTALLVTGPHTCLLVDLWLIKALELAGYATVVMALEARHWDRYYRLAGASKVHSWSDFPGSQNLLEEAKAIVERSRSLQDIAGFEYSGARVGRIALSTALRELRLGTLHLESSPIQRQHLANLLARSMAFADAARKLLRQVAPQLAVFYETVYLRRGEIFDLCLQDRIRSIVWHPAHKNNHLIFKTYGLENREDHPVSLSPESWRAMGRMAWTDARRARLQEELSGAYSRGRLVRRKRHAILEAHGRARRNSKAPGPRSGQEDRLHICAHRVGRAAFMGRKPV